MQNTFTTTQKQTYVQNDAVFCDIYVMHFSTFAILREPVSFPLQGIFLAILYCFLNSEVQDVIKRHIKRFTTRHDIYRATHTEAEAGPNAHFRTSILRGNRRAAAITADGEPSNRRISRNEIIIPETITCDIDEELTVPLKKDTSNAHGESIIELELHEQGHDLCLEHGSTNGSSSAQRANGKHVSFLNSKNNWENSCEMVLLHNGGASRNNNGDIEQTNT